tara:strand:- start:125 stop:343 length:219 start_codon:yes stop_codon:yes gene_type:complete
VDVLVGQVVLAVVDRLTPALLQVAQEQRVRVMLAVAFQTITTVQVVAVRVLLVQAATHHTVEQEHLPSQSTV